MKQVQKHLFRCLEDLLKLFVINVKRFQSTRLWNFVKTMFDFLGTRIEKTGLNRGGIFLDEFN